MKIEKLKLYGATLALIAATAMGANNTVTVHAEEVLWEDTEDDYTLEDIPEGEQPPKETEKPEVKPQPTPTPTPVPTPTPTENPLDNTVIDPEDQEYNTGRTEIPDYVETEAERKGLTTPEPDPTPEKTPTPQPVPKTGFSAEKIIIGGGAAGLVAGAGISIWYEIKQGSISKVVASRKKYKKNNKKRTK